MAYNFLDKNFNSIGILTNTGGQLNSYWGDQITHSIATSNDVLTSVSLSIDKATTDIDTNGNQKEWNHTIQGLSFGIDGVGKDVSELNYIVYQDGDQGHYYLMTITQVDESLTTSGFHFKTVQGINSAAYDLSRKTLNPMDFAIVPTGTQKVGSVKNILNYIFSDLGWDVRVIGNFPSIDYTITDSVSAQSVLQDVIKLFDAEVDAHVLINNISSGSNVFTGAGSIKRIFEFSTAIGNDNGDVVRLNKNLVSLTKTGARDSLYTKLYVMGNDIDIAPANNGANFIYDDNANKKYNSVGANSTPVQYLEGVINNSGIKDPQALLTWGKKQLKALNHPRYNYTVTAVDGKNVHLGDEVVIQDLKASQPIVLKSKIISKTISFADPQTDSFILGEFSPIVISAINKNDSVIEMINKTNQIVMESNKKIEETNNRVDETNDKIDKVSDKVEKIGSGIDKAVDKAVNDAKLYTDNLNQHQLELTNSLAADVQKKADSLSASQQHLASQATSYVDNVFADVNSKAVDAKTTADGVYQAIYDPEIGINARVSTAEGNFEQIKSSVNGMINTTTSTADGLTREIKDRETGDSNTLQAGKDFTTSQIKDYDTGMKTQLSQTANGIIATVNSINLVIDSSLINNLSNWKKFGTNGWEIDRNNTYYGVKFAKFNNFNHSNQYSYLTSQNIYIKSFPGKTVYVSVDVNTPNIGGGSTDYIEVYLIEQDSSGKQIKWNTITQQIKQPTSGWANFRQKIDIGDSTNSIYLGYQAVGNIETYIARPYVGVSELPQNGYVAGANNNNSTVLSLLKDNWDIGIADNVGKITSGITADNNNMNLINKNITLTGTTIVTADFYALGGNFKNLNAGNLTTGKVRTDLLDADSIVAKGLYTTNATIGNTLTMGGSGKIVSSYTKSDSFTDLEGKDINYTLVGKYTLSQNGMTLNGKATGPSPSDSAGAVGLNGVGYIPNSWTASADISEAAIYMSATGAKGYSKRSGNLESMPNATLQINPYFINVSGGSHKTSIYASGIVTDLVNADLISVTDSIFSARGIKTNGHIDSGAVTINGGHSIYTTDGVAMWLSGGSSTGGAGVVINDDLGVKGTLTSSKNIAVGWDITKNGTGFHPDHFNNLPGIHIQGTNAGITFDEKNKFAYFVVGNTWYRIASSASGSGSWGN